LSCADRLSRLFVIAAHDDAGAMRGLAAVLIARLFATRRARHYSMEHAVQARASARFPRALARAFLAALAIIEH